MKSSTIAQVVSTYVQASAAAGGARRKRAAASQAVNSNLIVGVTD